MGNDENMGDHRANIKIEMEFHGEKKTAEMWINYFPEECCGMDKRVVEFFQEVYEKGMKKFDHILEKQREKEIENEEKMELERLQKKYGKGSPNAYKFG